MRDTSSLWQQFINEHIPLAHAMALQVRVASPQRVVLAAPLAPNHNDKGTGFAGSLGAIATLAGWLLAQINASETAAGAITVIAESSTTYLRPVTGDFTAECRFDDDRQLAAFREALLAGRKGRLDLEVTVSHDVTRALHYSGRYVSWLAAPTTA